MRLTGGGSSFREVGGGVSGGSPATISRDPQNSPILPAAPAHRPLLMR